MRYSLRTLLIVMLLGGRCARGEWKAWEAWHDSPYDQPYPPGSHYFELYNPWFNDDGSPRDDSKD